MSVVTYFGDLLPRNAIKSTLVSKEKENRIYKSITITQKQRNFLIL